MLVLFLLAPKISSICEHLLPPSSEEVAGIYLHQRQLPKKALHLLRSVLMRLNIAFDGFEGPFMPRDRVLTSKGRFVQVRRLLWFPLP